MNKKKSKRKIRASVLLLIFSFTFFIFTRTFVNSTNARLTRVYQNNELKIMELTKMSETLQLDIRNLSAFDRVYSIVIKDGLSLRADNS